MLNNLYVVYITWFSAIVYEGMAPRRYTNLYIIIIIKASSNLFCQVILQYILRLKIPVYDCEQANCTKHSHTLWRLDTASSLLKQHKYVIMKEMKCMRPHKQCKANVRDRYLLNDSGSFSLLLLLLRWFISWLTLCQCTMCCHPIIINTEYLTRIIHSLNSSYINTPWYSHSCLKNLTFSLP